MTIQHDQTLRGRPSAAERPTSSWLKASLCLAGRLLVSRLEMPRLSAYASLIRWWTELSGLSWNLHGGQDGDIDVMKPRQGVER